MKKKRALQAVLRQDLFSYIHKTFKVVDPGTEFKPNWHIDCIAEYLEACYEREIQRLIINMPPRYLKSISCSVAFPSWVLGKDPTEKLLCASYANSLALNFSKDCRKVMRRPFYAETFPDTKISPFHDTKSEYETTAGGHRIATSVGGGTTGRGGNILIFDDPEDKNKASVSETYRDTVHEWFDGTASDRINNEEEGVMVVVQQRIHKDDLTNHLLEKNRHWEHLKIPIKAPSKTTFDLRDFHYEREEGEPLQPERHDEQGIADRKDDKGSANFQAQDMQEPGEREAGTFREQWWVIQDQAPSYSDVLRWWDLAATDSDDADWLVGAKMGEDKFNEGVYYVDDIIRKRISAHEVEKLVESVAERDGQEVDIWIEQEPGATGKITVSSFRRRVLKGHVVYSYKPDSSKQQRAKTPASAAEAGNLRLIKGDWNDDFIDEAKKFPDGDFDDMVDAVSMGHLALTGLIEPNNTKKNAKASIGDV